MQRNLLAEVTMMSHPHRWPRWPILPIKRSGEGFPECAVMYANGKPIVYLTDMYELRRAGNELLEAGEKPRWGDVLGKFESKEYEDYEAIVDDGWVVD